MWLTSLFAIEVKRSSVPNSVSAWWSHITGICVTSGPGVCSSGEIQQKAQSSESICQSRKWPLRSGVSFVHEVRHLENTMGSNSIQFMTKQIQIRSLKELNNMEKNKNEKTFTGKANTHCQNWPTGTRGKCTNSLALCNRTGIIWGFLNKKIILFSRYF